VREKVNGEKLPDEKAFDTNCTTPGMSLYLISTLPLPSTNSNCRRKRRSQISRPRRRTSLLRQADPISSPGLPLQRLPWTAGIRLTRVRRGRKIAYWMIGSLQWMEYAQHVLVGGKTKLRISFLQDELLSLAKHAGRSIVHAIVFVVFITMDLNLSQIMGVFKLLTLTYL
jgi:hypothetical protein